MKINLTEASDALREAFPSAQLSTVRADESIYSSEDRKIKFSGYVSVEDFHMWTDDLDSIEKVIETLQSEYKTFAKKKSRFTED